MLIGPNDEVPPLVNVTPSDALVPRATEPKSMTVVDAVIAVSTALAGGATTEPATRAAMLTAARARALRESLLFMRPSLR